MRTLILDEAELDFIEFISIKKARDLNDVKDDYIKLREQFDFSSRKFKEFGLAIYELNSLYYSDRNEADLIASYKHHEFMHLLRFLSYGKVVNESRSFIKKIKTVLSLVKEGKLRALFIVTKRKLSSSHSVHTHDFVGISNLLLKHCQNAPKDIVDYGCGPGFISFALSKAVKEKYGIAPITHLVDIDTLVLEYTEFRFKKHNLPITVTKITEEEMYPTLPSHDICIVTEVLEHVPKPEIVAANIVNSLRLGGVAYGSIDDHAAHTFHISPNLEAVRNLLRTNNIAEVDRMIFKKQ